MIDNRDEQMRQIEWEAVDFLQPDDMELLCSAVRFPDDITQLFREETVRIGQDAALRQMAVQFHRELFIERRVPAETNKRLLALGPTFGMLAAVVYMGALPLVKTHYDTKRIPLTILIDTVQDMLIWMKHYRQKYGVWGLSQLDWMYNHMSGVLYRIGRLQFHFASCPFAVKVFQRYDAEEVVVLSDAGVRIRADGKVDGTNGIYDSEHGWETSFSSENGCYSGHPVTPSGTVVRESVSLSAAEWEQVLGKGDTVLNIHIPEGSPMTHEACRDSYAQAREVAATSFPDKPFNALICSSWLLAPQLKELLPGDSNIVRFQRDYRLVPMRSDEGQTLERVYGFGTTLADLPQVPKISSLQRAVFDYLSAGNAIHNGAGFILNRPRY